MEDGAVVTTEQREPGPVMRVALGYQRAADRFAEWTGTISQYIVLVTVAVGFANVVLRYTGEVTGRRMTNNGMIEAQWYLYSLIFLLGFAYILKHQINVRVDFWFADRPAHQKAWIDLIGHSISLIPFALIGIRYSWPAVQFSWKVWEQSPDPSGLPRAPIKAMILVAFVLLLVQGIAELVKVVAVLRGHGEIEESHEFIRIE
jgi:TRAP-type mannitol/chloroaromatic compound transport system permease small subunit